MLPLVHLNIASQYAVLCSILIYIYLSWYCRLQGGRVFMVQLFEVHKSTSRPQRAVCERWSGEFVVPSISMRCSRRAAYRRRFHVGGAAVSFCRPSSGPPRFVSQPPQDLTLLFLSCPSVLWNWSVFFTRLCCLLACTSLWIKACGE